MSLAPLRGSLLRWVPGRIPLTLHAPGKAVEELALTLNRVSRTPVTQRSEVEGYPGPSARAREAPLALPFAEVSMRVTGGLCTGHAAQRHHSPCNPGGGECCRSLRRVLPPRHDPPVAHRPVDPRGRFREARRGGARRRRGRRRLDPYRRHGRAFRAQHHARAGHRAGAPAALAEALRRAPDDRPGRPLSSRPSPRPAPTSSASIPRPARTSTARCRRSAGSARRPASCSTPARPRASIEPVLDMVDLVLCMTVNPGFGGQAFIGSVCEKVRRIKAMIGGRAIDIEIDGGVTPETAPLVDGGRRQCPRRRLGRVQGRAFRLQGQHRGDPPRRRKRARANGRERASVVIPRYSRPEMVAIWSPETRFRIWFEIEAHATTALAELGVVPREAAATIWEKGSKAVFDAARIDEIEREVKHDVIAFLTHLAEIVGPEARFVHQGMTSSDVLDTCFNVQLVRAAEPAARRPRRASRRAQAPRLRAQDDADHRPLARHPRRADHLRAQARAGLCRVRARQAAADRGAARGRDLRHLRRRRHLRQHRPVRRGIRRREDGARRSSRSRPRSSRATATPCSSRRSP